jgi:hypothetical protein
VNRLEEECDAPQGERDEITPRGDRFTDLGGKGPSALRLRGGGGRADKSGGERGGISFQGPSRSPDGPIPDQTSMLEIKILQCNTNRSRISMELLEQKGAEVGADVLVVSEPNKKMASEGRWVTDLKGDATIKVREGMARTRQVGKEDGFAWVEWGKYRVYSCYASPNAAFDDFEQYLDALERSVSG